MKRMESEDSAGRGVTVVAVITLEDALRAVLARIEESARAVARG